MALRPPYLMHKQPRIPNPPPVTGMGQLDYLRADRQPGKCMCCDELLPDNKGARGRERLMCREPECLKLYQRLFHADRRRRLGMRPRSVPVYTDTGCEVIDR